MTEIKDNELIYIDEKKNEVLCTILFTFHSDKYKKDYILFYPNDEAKNDEINIIAACYDPQEFDAVSDKDKTLAPIETEEEWALVQEQLDAWHEDHEIGSDEEEDE